MTTQSNCLILLLGFQYRLESGRPGNCRVQCRGDLDMSADVYVLAALETREGAPVTSRYNYVSELILIRISREVRMILVRIIVLAELKVIRF